MLRSCLDLLGALNVVIVSGGSGNAISCSLLYQHHESFQDEVTVAALNVAVGKTAPVDYIGRDADSPSYDLEYVLLKGTVTRILCVLFWCCNVLSEEKNGSFHIGLQ